MARKPTEFCVLVDPHLMSRHVRSIENAVETAGVEVPLVIVNEPEDPTIDPGAEADAINEGIGWQSVRLATKVLRRERAWTLVILEKQLSDRLGHGSASSSRTPVEDVPCFADAEIQYVTPIADGDWSEFPPETVERVRETCDGVIRFGFSLIRGEILDATEFGVLSFHPADIRKYRGLGAPQAWLDGQDVMGVTLQRLNDEIDGGEIIAYRETDVSDCRTLWEVFDRLHDLQVELMVEGIENLRDPTVEPIVPEELGPYYPTRSKQTLSFAGRTFLKNVRGHLGRVADRG